MLRNNLCAKYFFPFIFNAILWRNFSWLEALWSKVTVLLVVVEGNRFSLSNRLFFTFFGSQWKLTTLLLWRFIFLKMAQFAVMHISVFVWEQLCGASVRARSARNRFLNFNSLYSFFSAFFKNLAKIHLYQTLLRIGKCLGLKSIPKELK